MQNIWIELSKAISCGGCGKTTTIESPHTCGKCGRMLCGSCGVWCKDHAPNKVLHTDGADSAREYVGWDIQRRHYGRWVL